LVAETLRRVRSFVVGEFQSSRSMCVAQACGKLIGKDVARDGRDKGDSNASHARKGRNSMTIIAAHVCFPSARSAQSQ
jgi:hypothetical protein